MADNCLKLMKDIKPQIQGALQAEDSQPSISSDCVSMHRNYSGEKKFRKFIIAKLEFATGQLFT